MNTAIVDHLWQSTLCVVVAWLLTLALRNNAARVRYWVWMAASIKFLIPFSLLTALGGQFSWRDAGRIDTSNEFFTVVEQFADPLATPEIVLRAPQAESFDIVPILVAIWIAGGVLLLLRWCISWRRVASAVRTAEPVKIQSPIAVKSTSVMSEPGVVGVFRPVLLLPEGIASRLTPAQLQAVLAHELCHVRRRDNLTAAIHMLVEVVFWFHPLVWWIGARLLEERERACDEAVVELGNEPKAYAEGILKVCQFYMESRLACVAGVSGANLKKRVEVIMRGCIATQLGVIKKSMLTLAGCAAVAGPVVIGMNTIVPQEAQAQAPQNLQYYFKNVLVKPTASDERSLVTFFMMQGRLVTKNRPIKPLIALAYGVNEAQVMGGPEWINSTPYDIEATANEKPPSDGPAGMTWYRPMVQKLLMEQFSLNAHRETQMAQSYVLRVAEDGAKFKSLTGVPMDAIAQGRVIHTGDVVIANVTPLAPFVGFLSKRLGANVVDQTGLTGVYNFTLKGNPSKESLPAAMREQLGLTLEAQSAPVEVVVVDYAQSPLLVGQSTDGGAAKADVFMEIMPADQAEFKNFRKDLDWRMPDQSVRDLIVGSYQVQAGQIVGAPDWIDSQRYHIAFGGDGLKQFGAEHLEKTALVNRALLTDRFALKFHREVRNMQVYVLGLSAQGINMQGLVEKQPVDTGLPSILSANPADPDGFPQQVVRAPMPVIASVLSRKLKSVVLDRTGLGGTYAFHLQGEPSVESLPELFRSQLGLTLELRSESVEVFVIDSIHPPVLNTQSMQASVRPRVD